MKAQRQPQLVFLQVITTCISCLRLWLRLESSYSSLSFDFIEGSETENTNRKFHFSLLKLFLNQRYKPAKFLWIW